MGLDLALLFVFLTVCLFGAYRGAVRQVSKILAMGLSFALAQVCWPWLAPRLPSSVGPVFVPQKTLAILLVCGVGTLLLPWMLRGFLQHYLGPPDLFRQRLDRWAGFALGGLFAASIGYAALCSIASFQAYTAPHLRVEALEQSHAYQWARTNNVFYGHGLDEMDRLWSVSTLEQTPGFSALRESPRFREILDRPETRELIARGDLPQLIKRLLEQTHQEREAELERAASNSTSSRR